MIVTLLLVLAMHWCSLESALAVATQPGRVRDRIESSPAKMKISSKMASWPGHNRLRRRVGQKLLGKAEAEIYLPDRGLQNDLDEAHSEIENKQSEVERLSSELEKATNLTKDAKGDSASEPSDAWQPQ